MRTFRLNDFPSLRDIRTHQFEEEVSSEKESIVSCSHRTVKNVVFSPSIVNANDSICSWVMNTERKLQWGEQARNYMSAVDYLRF